MDCSQKKINSGELKVTTETRLRRHLAAKGKSTSSKILVRYYSWQKRVFQEVTVERINKIEGVQQLINDANQLHCFEPKLCYDNAMTLTTFVLGEKEIGYVEGFVVVNERWLVPHAWNSAGDQYFDYTRELANEILIELGKPLGRWEYFKVIELPFRELYPFTKSCRVPIQVPYFRKQNRLLLSNSKGLWRALREGSEDLS